MQSIHATGLMIIGPPTNDAGGGRAAVPALGGPVWRCPNQPHGGRHLAVTAVPLRSTTTPQPCCGRYSSPSTPSSTPHAPPPPLPYLISPRPTLDTPGLPQMPLPHCRCPSSLLPIDSTASTSNPPPPSTLHPPPLQ